MIHPLIDSHAHLEMADFEADRDTVLERARAAGVAFILTVGSGADSGCLETAVALATRPGIGAAVGIHPHEASRCSAPALDRVAALAREPDVLAIGEIGLDYHYDFSPRPAQREAFAAQLQLARQLDRPVVIHSRSADTDTIDLLTRHWSPPHPGGVLHCFTGDQALADQALALGLYISFAGIVTFPRAESLRQVAATVPADRLLIETDAPYLTPVPFRGKRNEPAYLPHILAALAAIRPESSHELARRTCVNFQALFRVDPAECYTGATPDAV